MCRSRARMKRRRKTLDRARKRYWASRGYANPAPRRTTKGDWSRDPRKWSKRRKLWSRSRLH